MVLLSLALLGATRYTLPDQPPHRNLERLVTRHVVAQAAGLVAQGAVALREHATRRG